jgi:hypothetical protein
VSFNFRIIIFVDTLCTHLFILEVNFRFSILNSEFKGDRYFVEEVESQLREKPLRGSQTQDIHYSEDKASYKAVVLTYPYAVVVP